MNVRTVVAVGIAAALSACGPGMKLQSGKQAAAEAVYALSGPTSGGFGGGAFNASCAKGGSVGFEGFQLNVNTGGGGASVGQTLSLSYKGCSVATQAGTMVLNGTIDVTQYVAAGTAGASVQQGFKGKMYLQGAFDDFLDMEVTEGIDVTTGGQGTSAAVVLKGSVANSTGSYSFNDTISVTPGTVSVQVSASAKQ